nr:MAG TPA: hypothetical protein [Caudoviricetes sp.]
MIKSVLPFCHFKALCLKGYFWRFNNTKRKVIPPDI